jgi:hypothetical protein
MGLTTDPGDPDLSHGVDTGPVPQSKKYLVLSGEERAKGFVRPLRDAYRHAGPPGPQDELRDLTGHEKELYPRAGYVKFEVYGPGRKRAAEGRYWTQQELDAAGKGCGHITTMGPAIAETYAARPHFYGATYCANCRMHLPVGEMGEFTWMTPDGQDTAERVGT